MEYRQFQNYKISFSVPNAEKLPELEGLVDKLDKLIYINPEDLRFSVNFKGTSEIEFRPTNEEDRRTIKIFSKNGDGDEVIIEGIDNINKVIALTYDNKKLWIYSN